MTDGPLSIASGEVSGAAKTAGYSGEIRVGESYDSDQYSQIQVTSDSIDQGTEGDSGGEWIGLTVRNQDGGQDGYRAMYFYNSGQPQLRLAKRIDGSWTPLGFNYDSGFLPAGTTLTLTAVGSTIALWENGVEKISATDPSPLTGGAPGIMTYDAAKADNWSGGDATAPPAPPAFKVLSNSTDQNGVESYDVVSADDGYGPHIVRILQPTDPAPGVPHNFLYVLPVEPELGTQYGDGLETMRELDAQNRYNLTIVEPSFAVDPWYADNPGDQNLDYETFMTDDLVPWVTQQFGTTGDEQNWLIGFSKSGLGAQDLLLRHPDLFTAAASWDFPADQATFTTDDGASDGDGANYGTDDNFQDNYRLTPSFVQAHAQPFTSEDRIWIGGYSDFEADISQYSALLCADDIQYDSDNGTELTHVWGSGWVGEALAALAADGENLPAGP